MKNELVSYEAARQALQQATRLDDVRGIHDKAAALAQYARQAKDTELLAYATEVRVRAQRRAGQLLIEQVDKGQRLERGATHRPGAVSLAELGISRQLSSQWQQLARLTDARFEQAVAQAKASMGQVTARHMVIVARQYAQARRRLPNRPSERRAAAAGDPVPPTPRVTLLAQELLAWLATGPKLVKPQKIALAKLAVAIEKAIRP